jgi:hypothetical protein
VVVREARFRAELRRERELAEANFQVDVHGPILRLRYRFRKTSS